MKTCEQCHLYRHVKHVKIEGIGPVPCDLMLVGEAPGYDEDKTGAPFIGRSGQLLTRILEDEVGIKRADVFITNAVKCRPYTKQMHEKGNRQPTNEEIETCYPYLLEELETVRPRVVIALGATAFHALSGDCTTSIAHARKSVWELTIENETSPVNMIVTYHPAAVLRNPKWRKAFVTDLKTAVELAEVERWNG